MNHTQTHGEAISIPRPYKITRDLMDHPAIQSGNTIFAYLAPAAFKSAEEMEATANSIVRACNAHDDLVEALEMLMRNFEEGLPLRSTSYRQAVSALKLARGE